MRLTNFIQQLLLFPLLLVLNSAVASTKDSVQYVGFTVCAGCHSEQASLWAGSHHDLAMQEASDKTVLGDFNNTSLLHYGVESSFTKKQGRFMVRTEGPAGKMQDYEIKYTFGVEPLQQYLVEFPGGRMQVLSLAWDTRSKQQGGQRWFHLYPNEKIAADDELHWTQPGQNWNSMCAECHSTYLQKNYDQHSKTFDTRWQEIDVSCEACHGPGSSHVNWAKSEAGWEKLKSNKGLFIQLDERKGVHWKIDAKTGNAIRSNDKNINNRNSDKEIEMCARCHSRRSPISSDYRHGEPLLDHYLPRLLDEGMYHADGQIDDEVYVYGSFLQSKMYHAGVTCSDCHQPHSLNLKVPGNGVCLQCHAAKKYDAKSHHFHQPESTGASCAECHMPPKTYMVVDPRHDHSIRIPRPDLSAELATPNACNNCHQGNTPQWAAKQVKSWYGHQPTSFQSYSAGLHAARQGLPGAGKALADIIRQTQTPYIARATALNEIAPYLSQQTIEVLSVGLSDENAAMRVATIGPLETLPMDLRVRLLFPMLNDPIRAVRIEAARALASVPAGDLPAQQRVLLVKGLQEYVESQQAMAERPEAQTNLGSLYGAQGKIDKAISAFDMAIELNPNYVPAYVNLADLYRVRGDESRTESVLRKALKVIPASADIHHALGLSLVRQKRTEEAVQQLRQSSTLNPNNVRYGYIYAVALNSTGDQEQAVAVLQEVHTTHPNNVDILSALVAFHRDLGNEKAARSYAGKLREISP